MSENNEEGKKGRRVSYSQYSIWSQCKYRYKLAYVDKLSEYVTNIYAIFGTAMHETVQEFLRIMYEVSSVEALQMDLHGYLKERMIEIFKEAKEEMDELPCTKEELTEFYLDGCAILDWMKSKKNLSKYYRKKDWELYGIETPLNHNVRDGVRFVAFLDIILRSKKTGKFKIIDLKTSTMGWNKYVKKMDVKNNQIRLYKKFFAEQFGVPLEDISIEFHILKRKLYENMDFIQHRFQKHIPSHGTRSTKKAYESFMEFVNTVFDENGERRTDIPYPKTPGKNKKNCRFCEFGPGGLGICDQTPE